MILITSYSLAGSGTDAPLDNTTMDISSQRFRSEFLQEWHSAQDTPYFDPSTPRNITGLVGHPVRLLCRVKNLQNRTVSNIYLYIFSLSYNTN